MATRSPVRSLLLCFADRDQISVWNSRIVDDESDRFASGKIVVLAANGIENPMILLRSDAANSSKTVGCYLMDHPIKQSYGLAIEPLYPFRGPQTTSQIENFRDTPQRREFAAFKTSIKNDGWSSTSANITAPRGNAIPKSFFGAIEPKRRIPRNNVLFVGFFAFVGTTFLTFERAAELLNFGALLAFMGVNAASFTRYFLRERRRDLSNFLIPVLGFIVCLLLWLNLSRPAKIAGVIWMALGIAYGAYRTRGFKAELVTFDVPPHIVNRPYPD